MGNSHSNKKYQKLEKKCFFCLRKLPLELLTNDDTTNIYNNYTICHLCLNTKKRMIKNYVAKYRKYPSNGELLVIEANLKDLLKDFTKEELNKIDANEIV